jgi:putative ABC transport system permease protein
MTMLLKIAWRNILRNRRRSAVTALAVAAGAQALLLFGGFQANIFTGLETGAVQRSGHLAAFREGYFLYGAGNPSVYGIDDYQEVIERIAHDEVLAPLLNVVTPTLALVGIAGNYAGATSAAKTFLGTGFIPSDRVRMRQWNEHGVVLATAGEPPLKDGDPAIGFVGLGLGRILGLCGQLKIADCPQPPALPERPAVNAPAEDVAGLQEASFRSDGERAHDGMPRLDLLAATAAGAPNVVSLFVAAAHPQGVKELDENVIGMHLSLAQQLVYGRGKPAVTGITVQLHRTRDLEKARARLASLFRQQGWKLEVRDFGELNPFYVQVKQMFGSMFLFIAVIMGVIVLFTIVNTMTMAVLERTIEIGTTRALGVQRAGIRRQFVVEGALLGALGASAGVVVAALAAFALNHAGLSWTPPANSQPVPFRVDLWGRTALIAATWTALTLIATLAARVPANRAAKLQIVDALRHV